MNDNDLFLTNSTIPLQQSEFLSFQKLIYEWAGIHMSEAKKTLIAGRLLKRLRHYNFGSYQQYINHILSPGNEVEKQMMINLLTTNETYFFRESQHLDYLAEKIIPAIQLSGGEKFRIWSAASSSGQEAYSIAMILEDELGSGKWEILGTDINETVLQKAKNALYPIETAEKIPQKYLKKYCLKGVRSQEGSFTIVPELKKNIEFIKLNLNEDFPNIGFFNVVFLRNVMIYFDMETKKKLVERIYNVLKYDGLLITGHSENLNNISTKFKSIIPTVYRKL